MDYLVDLVMGHGVLVVFAATLAARLGVPVPAAPLLVVAGGVSVGDQPTLLAVLAVAVVANVLGDGAWFYAGRQYGQRVLALLCRISISPDSCVRQSESMVLRWGGSSLVAAKFVPGVSVVAAPMAGALGMSLRRFVAYDAIGGAAWSLLFLALGVVFSDQIDALLIAMSNAGLAAGGLLLLAIVGFVGWRWWRRRRFLRAVGIERITVDELHELVGRGVEPVIIDVRSPIAAEIDPRRIPGAVLIEMHLVPQHAAQLPRDREIVTYCNCPNEATAATAAQALADAGFTRVRPLLGGLDAWEAAGRPMAAHGEPLPA